MTDVRLGDLLTGALVTSGADAPLGSPLYWVMGASASASDYVEVRSVASGRFYRWPADRMVTLDSGQVRDEHYRRLERIRTLVQGTERPRTPEAIDWAWSELIRILND